MDIDEVLNQAHITHDDKARRILNTASDLKPNIELSEIESGITIERLESLNVPVYQYATQITIHGTFPNINTDFLRVNGYKSVILNQNKSLGVRYIAIDGAKKQTLMSCNSFSKLEHKWHIYQNSQEFTMAITFHNRDGNKDDDKQRCMNCYNSVPDDLYVGAKRAAVYSIYGMYAGCGIEINIGAIYQQNLWKLIKYFTGIENQAEYDKLVTDYEAKRKAENAKYEAERKAEAERKQAELTKAISDFKPPDNWKPFKGKIEKIGTYAHICTRWNDGSDKAMLQVIKVAKRGPYICDTTKNFPDFHFVDWKPDHFSQGTRTIDGWQIMETVKTATDKPNSGVKPIIQSTNQDITITHNEKLNGIEIRFKNKPDDTTLDKLRSNGFRWSYKGMLWYARYTPELMTKIQDIINSKVLVNTY